MQESIQKNSQDVSIAFVVDASTSPVQIGIPEANGWTAIIRSDEQALEGLFSASEKTMKETGRKISEINRIFYCEGPGSTLGLRIAAAFVRTLRWTNKKPAFSVFSYNALDLASALAPDRECTIQAPFRMGLRFVRIPHEDPQKSEKKIIPEEEAFGQYPSSYHLPDIRKRSKSVSPKQTLTYDLSKINGLADLLPISRPCPEILPYNPKAPVFKKWSPQVLLKKTESS